MIRLEELERERIEKVEFVILEGAEVLSGAPPGFLAGLVEERLTTAVAHPLQVAIRHQVRRMQVRLQAAKVGHGRVTHRMFTKGLTITNTVILHQIAVCRMTRGLSKSFWKSGWKCRWLLFVVSRTKACFTLINKRPAGRKVTGGNFKTG